MILSIVYRLVRRSRASHAHSHAGFVLYSAIVCLARPHSVESREHLLRSHRRQRSGEKRRLRGFGRLDIGLCAVSYKYRIGSRYQGRFVRREELEFYRHPPASKASSFCFFRRRAGPSRRTATSSRRERDPGAGGRGHGRARRPGPAAAERGRSSWTGIGMVGVRGLTGLEKTRRLRGDAPG